MHLLVMAKEPVAGRVKTRLCPPCSPDQAAAVAEAALADTLDAAVASGADQVIVALDGRPGSWCPSGVTVIEQVDGPLERRLTAAWQAVGGPGIQIGMDTPQVGAGQLDRAMENLSAPACDAVFGPANDGGWWLIGMTQPHSMAFSGVPMSRPDTGARQLERLQTLGMRVTGIDRQRDVDHWSDAVLVAASVPGSRFAAAVGSVARAQLSIA